MLANLHFVRDLGREIKKLLVSGDVGRYGELMHEHWMRKRLRSTGMTSDRVDQLYELARARGAATGGKLVGAGELASCYSKQKTATGCVQPCWRQG